jgi:1-acyl-sn-glycerol-3-phosphate acyltransferase
LHVFDRRIAEDRVGYPYRIPHLHVYAPLPERGEVQVDARFAGFEGDDARFPAFELQLSQAGRALVQLRLVEILMPKGPIGRASPADRAAFLRDRRYVPGLGLSDRHGDETVLSDARVAESDWLPGTLAKLYGAAEDRTRAIAVAEHIAERAAVHPSLIDADRAVVRTHPLLVHPLAVSREGSEVHVKSTGAPHLELAQVRSFWAERFGLSRWPVEDMCFGLIDRFVEDVTVEDPAAHAAIRGQSVMYLANHQTGIESILFSVLASALQGVTTMTLAKAEHRDSWIGQLLQLWFTYPGAHDPGVIAHFDRKDAASLLTILEDLGRTMRAGKSLLVHVEGTRARSARARTTNMSGAFVDLALAVGTPIIPVRFTGGLPVEEASERLEFPVGFGKQRYHLGRPLLPSELSKLTYRARTERILAAINALGEPPETERPTVGDPAFAAKVAAHVAKHGVSAPHATIHEVLAELPDPCTETKQLLGGTLDAHAPEFLRTLTRWLSG